MELGSAVGVNESLPEINSPAFPAAADHYTLLMVAAQESSLRGLTQTAKWSVRHKAWPSLSNTPALRPRAADLAYGLALQQPPDVSSE